MSAPGAKDRLGKVILEDRVAVDAVKSVKSLQYEVDRLRGLLAAERIRTQDLDRQVERLQDKLATAEDRIDDGYERKGGN